MTRDEAAPLVEPFHEEGVEQTALPIARPWRRIGLAIAAFTVLGAAVGTMMLRRKPVTPIQRWHRMRHSLLEAFSARALKEAADLTARFDFTFAEVDQEDPSAMSMLAKAQTSDEEADSLQFVATFAAKEGKGDDLVAQFQKVVDGIQSFAEAMYGEDSGQMVHDIVSVEAGDTDEAVITITPPAPDEHAQEEMKKAFEPAPTLTASLSTGRDLQQMFEHKDDNIAMLPQGIKGTMDAALAHTLFKAVEDEMDEMGGGGHNGGRHYGRPGPDPMEMLGAMSSIDIEHDLRYRSGENEAFAHLPSLTDILELYAHGFAEGPRSILGPIHGLADLADGVKSAEIKGLPNSYGVQMTFTNVHITPILQELIGDIDAENAPEGPEEKGGVEEG